MLTRFATITNGFVSLGKPIFKYQKMRKIIIALSKSWEVKANFLKELNDKEKIDFTTFMGYLKTMIWREGNRGT